jgi:hypothetical protein
MASSFKANISNITANSAYFSADFNNDASSGFTGKRYLRLTVESEDGEIIYDEEQITGVNYSNGEGTKFSFTLSDLSDDTTYNWNVYLGYAGTGDEAISWLTSVNANGSFTTKKLILIDAWFWDKSNGDASDNQTKTAYKILKGETSVDDGFSYKVWNDLVEKIAEVRNIRPDISVEWDNAYATKNKTKVNVGDTLSATRFNSICYNINNMKGVSVSYVKSGDILYGKYIISLVETLNKIIGEL